MKSRTWRHFQTFLSVAALLTIILFLFSACAGTKKAPIRDNEKPGVQNFELMREDFDPLTLDDDDIRVEETIETDRNIDDILYDPKEIVEDSVITGYRVQLIQTTDPDEALSVQGDAVLQFDHGVYRVFDPPFYKVRVGDFAEWRDAEGLQQEALKRGYREAWVIRTKVNTRKSSELDQM